MLTPEQDARERKVAWAMLVLCPVSFLLIMVFPLTGVAPGIEAGHEPIYLESTCLAWAIVSVFLPILRLIRLVAVPTMFLVVVYANMYFYVISLNAGLYLNVSWWGDMGHVISSVIVSTIVFIALCAMEVHSPPHVTFGSRIGMVSMVFLVAMSFGGIWEMLEGFADFAGGDSYMVYGATDTMGDLAADTLGALAVAVGAYLYLGRRRPSDVVASLRIGRKAFEVGDDGVARLEDGPVGRGRPSHEDDNRGRVHRRGRCVPARGVRRGRRDRGHQGQVLG